MGATPFSIGTIGDFKVVEFKATSLLTSAAELERLATTLDLLADGQANGKLLLDFTHVETFASLAISIIISLHMKATHVAGGDLVLCGISPQLMRLLKITRLDHLLKIVKTREDVLNLPATTPQHPQRADPAAQSK